MPHSSGGGSSSGGFHSGSSYSSSSSSRFSSSYDCDSDERKVNVTYYPTKDTFGHIDKGLKKYYYFHKGNNVLSSIYVRDDDWTNHKKENTISFILTFLFIFAAVLIFLGVFIVPMLVMIKPYSKATPLTIDYDSEIKIVDSIDIFSDDEEEYTMRQLKIFQDKTGITPIIVTVSTENWIDNFDSLERLAYNYYVSKYPDEKHWVIIYSQSKIDPSKWCWEGMQGNDTDPILLTYKTDEFNKDLQGNIEAKGFNKAIGLSFARFSETVMETHYHGIFFVILGIYISLALVFPFIVLFKGADYNCPSTFKALLIQYKAYKEDEICQCEKCKKYFILRDYSECPYCERKE